MQGGEGALGDVAVQLAKSQGLYGIGTASGAGVDLVSLHSNAPGESGSALRADQPLDVIERLWSGLADQQVPLTDEQVAELRRRDERFVSELAAVRPIDAVWSDLHRTA